MHDATPILATIILITNMVVNAIFGLVVLARTYRTAYGRYFATTILGVVGWSFGDLFLLLGRNVHFVHAMAELFYIGPMLIPIFIWMFALSFPEDSRIRWRVWLASGVPFAVFSLMFLFHLDFFVSSIHITSGLNEATPQMPGFLIYAAFFSIYFVLTYIAFWLKLHRLKGQARTQVAYTYYGALFASVPALITNLSLPLLGVHTMIWLGPLFTLIFAASVTTAIVKHRLFDIRWYTIRSAAYLLSFFTIALLYVIPATLVTTYISHVRLRSGSVVLLSLITLAVAFLFEPVKRFFNRITNRFFYRDAYEPQEFFDQLNRILVTTAELTPLLNETLQLLSTNFKMEYGLIALGGRGGKPPHIVGTNNRSFSHEELRSIHSQKIGHVTARVIVTDYLGPEDDLLRKLLLKNNIAVLARLGNHENVDLGHVLLGPKKSGNPYNAQDLRVIETMTNELVIAIQNALRFEEIERFNATLQEKIDDATRKLRRTNDKLRKLDETKDDFISMASHQLRTPLTSVKGYVSMVLDGDGGELTAMQRKLLNQSFISAQRMVYLISDLLNVSRLRTGKFVIEPVPTNLAAVVKDEVSQLVETAKGRDLELVYYKPEHFPTLMLDDTKMRQVIMNFLDNAIYYTPRGGRIVVQLVDKPQSVELTVTDTGIGVAKHEQPHLFTKFFRAHNARRARPDGTGLGLFMAKKVIIAQGGAIIFKSAEGKGSTFGFTFAKSHLQPLPQPKQPAAGAAKP